MANEPKKQMSFTTAMKDYFGYPKGGGAGDFLKEMKALTEADKAWFRENLATVGYEIVSN